MCPEFFKLQKIWGEKANVKIRYIVSSSKIGKQAGPSIEQPGQNELGSFDSIGDDIGSQDPQPLPEDDNNSNPSSPAPDSRIVIDNESDYHSNPSSPIHDSRIVDESDYHSNPSSPIHDSSIVVGNVSDSQDSLSMESESQVQSSSTMSTESQESSSFTVSTTKPNRKFETAGTLLSSLGKKATMKDKFEYQCMRRDEIDGKRLELQAKQLKIQIEQQDRQTKIEKEKLILDRERMNKSFQLEEDKLQYAREKDTQDLERERLAIRKKELDIEELKLKASLGIN